MQNWSLFRPFNIKQHCCTLTQQINQDVIYIISQTYQAIYSEIFFTVLGL